MITLLQISPWRELNEYEAAVEVSAGARRLWCRVVLPSGRWDRFAPGDRLDGPIWLERSGEVASSGDPPGLTHIDGVRYAAVGAVASLDDDDRVTLDCGGDGPLVVDLDPVRGAPGWRVGDRIRVTGVLQLELE